jgi:integrase
LNFIGLEVGLPEFVSANGAIRSEMILKPTTRRASGKPTYIRVWDHACILEDDGSTKQGYAIGTETLEKLESEIDKISSRFIMRRSQVMVELFKYTAGRRAEVGNIRVPDIRKALDCASPEPMLTLPSRKGKRGAKREVPVPRHALEDALEFVETERKSLLREKGLPQAQASLLFISVRTGKPLSVKYISTQFWNLKKKAKISEKAHAHMLRHLGISKRFEQRANDLIGATTSPLITIDVIIDSISLELMQFSGHTSKQSLDVYAKLEKQKILKRVLEDARLPPQKSLSEINILNKLLIEISTMRPDEIEDFLKAKRDELLQEGPESNRP